MNLRELMIEYILFANDDNALMNEFQVLASELPDLSDTDLLEIYDKTLLTPIQEDYRWHIEVIFSNNSCGTSRSQEFIFLELLVVSDKNEWRLFWLWSV